MQRMMISKEVARSDSHEGKRVMKKICVLIAGSLIIFPGCEATQRAWEQVTSSGSSGQNASIQSLTPYLAALNDDDAIAAYFAVTASQVLASEISARLNEANRKKAQESVATTAQTGKSQTWEGEDGTRGSSRVTRTDRRTERVDVRRRGIASVPPIEVIAQNYVVQRQATSHREPDAASPQVQTLEVGTVVEVIGSVKANGWYLIGVNGVGQGYAEPSAFAPEPVFVEETVAPVAAAEETQQVEADREYRTIKQEVVLATGEVVTEEVTLVKEPDGSWKRVE